MVRTLTGRTLSVCTYLFSSGYLESSPNQKRQNNQITLIHSGPKSLTTFTIQLKIINFQKKCTTDFIWWIHIQICYTLSGVQCGHPISNEKHSIEIPVLSMREPLLWWQPWAVSSHRQLLSTLVTHPHRKKSSGVKSGNQGYQASGLSLPSLRFGNVAKR
jgi:hypothetical protein